MVMKFMLGKAIYFKIIELGGTVLLKIIIKLNFSQYLYKGGSYNKASQSIEKNENHFRNILGK